MVLVTSYEPDDYLPEYSTILLRDVPGQWPDIGGALSSTFSAGSFTCAGYGWLQALVSDGYHQIRLEYHDSEPDPAGEWDDVAETPYLSPTGVIGLTTLTGSPMDPDLTLGGPGTYRVRFSRRLNTVRYTCLLQFWPVDNPPDVPRRLTRSHPAVAPPDPGWTTILGFHGWELPYIVGQAAPDGATVEQITHWAVAHHRTGTWLDEPLHNEAYFAIFAEQLGVVEQLTRRRLLDMLVAVGVLDYDGRYRVVHPQPLAKDVLSLPADLVSALDVVSEATQYRGFADDLVSVAAWLSGRTTTIAALAEATLASADEIQSTLDYAVTRKMLEVTGDPELTMKVLPT